MSLERGQTTDPGGRLDVTDRAAEPGADDADGPLVGDATGLRASWQRIQAEFVDDPRDAVASAAALVDHAAQALAGALRQRQQRLRRMWDGTAARDDDPADAGAPAAGSAGSAGSAAGSAGSAADGSQSTAGVPDTEHLRLLMQRYRSLLDQICQPL
jgi:hypothetical protein